mmetsp:Transcript_38297/g.114685  ORF Transcript_38297/g.114685 Transcript_38297/m.114685 type:complete len:752 (-) Transcript_38297:278-2533(-)
MLGLPVVALPGPPLVLPLLLPDHLLLGCNPEGRLVLESDLGRFPRRGPAGRPTPGEGTGAGLRRLPLPPLGLSLGDSILHVGIAPCRASLGGVVGRTRTSPPLDAPAPLPFPPAFLHALHHPRRVHSQNVHLPLDLAFVQRPDVVLVLVPSPNRSTHLGVPRRTLPPARATGDLLTVTNLADGQFLVLVEVGLLVHVRARGLELGDQLGLLPFQLVELGVNVRIDVVGDVLAVEYLRDGVELPFRVQKIVLLPEVRRPNARTPILPHELPRRLLLGRVVHGRILSIGSIAVLHILLGDGVSHPRLLLLPQTSLVPRLHHALGDADVPRDAVPRRRMEYLEPIHDPLHLPSAHPTLHAGGEELVARGVLDLRHSLLVVVRHGHQRASIGLVHHGLNEGLLSLVQRLPRLSVHLVDHHDQLLVGEQRLDAPEQRALLLHRITARFGNVDEIQHRAGEMGQCRHRLHLDGVALLEGMVQYTGGVHDLPTEVSIVGVTDIEGLGREGVRLHVDLGPRNLVEEGGFADVGESAQQQSPGGRIQGGEAGHVLPHLLQIGQTRLLTLEDRAHPSQGGALEALATVEGIAVLDHPDHIAADGVAQGAGGVDLSEGELVVIAIVQDVGQVGIEGMDIREAGKIVEDLSETIRDGLLGELDLAHVERPDASNLVPRMDDGRRPPLRPGQHDVDHLGRPRHRLHLLEVIHGHLEPVCVFFGRLKALCAIINAILSMMERTDRLGLGHRTILGEKDAPRRGGR